MELYSAAVAHLSDVKWSEMISMTTQESWNLFIKHVTDCVDKYIPVEQQYQKKVRPKWLDAYCLKLVKQKSKIWNKYLHARDQND